MFLELLYQVASCLLSELLLDDVASGLCGHGVHREVLVHSRSLADSLHPFKEKSLGLHEAVIGSLWYRHGLR